MHSIDSNRCVRRFEINISDNCVKHVKTIKHRYLYISIKANLSRSARLQSKMNVSAARP